MPESPPGTDRLDSWKEIAAYLKRNQRTVSRWEKRGLPVHRVPGGKKQAVFAFKHELDAWLQRGETGALASDSGQDQRTSTIQPQVLDFHLSEDPAAEKSSHLVNHGKPKELSQQFLIYAALFAGAVVLVVAIWRIRTKTAEPSMQIQPIVRQLRDVRTPMVTDGTQLYFPECMSGRFRLARVNVQATESEATLFPTAVKNPDLADISPDGTQLLIREVPRFLTDTGRFYLQATDGRSAVPLDVRGLDGTWSRDGKRLYFSDEDKIYVANSDGSSPTIFLDHLGGRPFWLRWSPDGTELRFSLIQAHVYTLWEVTVTDNRLHELQWTSDGGESRCCGNWNSSGSLYFYQTRVHGVYQIWMRQESSGRIVPFEQQLEDYNGPTPARNSNILFARTETRRAELERFDRTLGSAQSVLPSVSISTAAISPDRQLIAYSTFPIRALYVSRLEGTQRRALTAPDMEAVLPVWSPDSARIAFMSRVSGSWQVYIIPAGGGNAKPLLEGARAEIRDPTWSRDGKQVLISYGPTRPGKPDSTGLYVIDVSSPKLDHHISGSDGLFSPRWSPDGRYIAALSAGASKLLLYNGRRGWRVVMEEAKLGYPNWSNDGRALFILDETGPTNVIKRVQIPDLKIDTVADLSAYQQPCTIFGGWVGIDGDSPLFIQDLSTRMIGGFKYELP